MCQTNAAFVSAVKITFSVTVIAIFYVLSVSSENKYCDCFQNSGICIVVTVSITCCTCLHLEVRSKKSAFHLYFYFRFCLKVSEIKIENVEV